jgi:hypothetical protein
MGIALLTLSALFEQLTVRSTWRSSAQSQGGSAPTRADPGAARVGLAKTCKARQTLLTDPLRDWTRQPVTVPLRVVQVTDDHARPGTVGRLLISGRMADVCAELDRLAALEDRQLLH